MIETLMALWNRGVGGRLVVMVVTFFCLCICISLLFVTVGGVWGSLFAHGRTRIGETRVNNTVVVMVTAPTAVASATAPVGSTPISVPNPCLASPTASRGRILQANSVRNDGQTRVRTTATATSTRLHKTPGPGATVLPVPSPTVAATATATTLPTVTPTVTSTPVVSPTVVVTPTDTSTPDVTPTTTAAVTPTVAGGTPAGGNAPTGTVTSTVMPATPTVTAPAGSLTVTPGAASGVDSREARDGRPQGSGTPTGSGSDQQGQGNCLSDDLVTGGEGAVLSVLQNVLWLILVSSLLGTALFCAQMYRISRKRHATNN
jgi:hypothetical protein